MDIVSCGGSVGERVMGFLGEVHNSPLGLMLYGTAIGVGCTLLKEKVYLTPWVVKKQVGFDNCPTGPGVPNTDRTCVVDGKRVIEHRVKLFNRIMTIASVNVGISVVVTMRNNSNNLTDVVIGGGAMFIAIVMQESLIGGFASVINRLDATEDEIGEKCRTILRLVNETHDQREEIVNLNERLENSTVYNVGTLSFIVPPTGRPGQGVTIQAPNGQRIKLILPPNTQPGKRMEIHYPTRVAEFTKTEIQDIMNGIFSVKDEIDDGRYLELNNKLKKIYDTL
jgi:hypothetical protein